MLEALVGAIVLGVAAGVVWTLLAPELQGQVTASGVAVRGAEARRQFSVDGWFAVVAAACGVVVAVVAALRHHRRPIMTLLTLVGAGLMGSVVAWRVGVVFGPGPVDSRAATGAHVAIPLALTAPGVLLIWPIASVVTVAIVAALLDDRRPWRSGTTPSDRSGPSSPSSD